MRGRILISAMTALCGIMPARAAESDLVVMAPQLSSLAAQRLGEACVAFAAKANTPTAVAVVDPAGHLMYFQARQGASPTAPPTAERKAITAARWRRATRQLSEEVKKGTNPESLWFGDFPQTGGVPIIQAGHTLGAIGVAGPGDDEGCAMAAIKAVFGNSVQTGRPVGGAP